MKKRPCYLCGDTEKEKDKFHPSRCRSCKREQSRSYMERKRQERLEKKFLNNEKGIKFCSCGDYFVSTQGNFSLCLNCRKSSAKAISLNERVGPYRKL